MSNFFASMVNALGNVALTAAQVKAQQDAGAKARRAQKRNGPKCTPCDAERRVQVATAQVNHLNGFVK